MFDELFQQLENPQDGWDVRRDEVISIKNYLKNHYGDMQATERLIPFGKDERWEVRIEVARAMASVSDNMLYRFMHLLNDCNHLVANKAQRSMEQRNLYVKSKEKQEKNESKIFRNLEKIRKKFGPEAARLAREDIEEAYQLTVGYAAHGYFHYYAFADYT